MNELQSGDHQTTQENADQQQVKGETKQEEEEQEVAEETKYVNEEDGEQENIYKEKEPDPGFNFLQEVEEEREEQNGMLSTEELNKKFEDFIRKMKEELRIEAKQKLVMV